jgi:glyceraldehyde-3-phosphate dehydrogenase (NAD(P))
MNILVIGTGTIGEPLIGLLADNKQSLGFSNLVFHKRTPLSDEKAKVNSLIDRGAKLAVNSSCVSEFKDLGHKVSYVFEDALNQSDVVIDCTPAGLKHMDSYYLPLYSSDDKRRFFIAQGSEKNFGVPFAYGINDKVLSEIKQNFIQVVSCNTHNICSLMNTLSGKNISNILFADFVCIRRANDISQDNSFIASPHVGVHNTTNFGTHHAQDAYDLFRTLGHIPNIFSSAIKTNTQYMHTIRFNITIKGSVTNKNVVEMLTENKYTAVTEKTSANKVFSFGRDHGYYGRILNHTVVSLPTLCVTQLAGLTRISGFCFTPQDGNSLLSSVAAGMYGIHNDSYENHIQCLDKYLFQEI